MMNKLLAWYFSSTSERLGHGDYRVIDIGVTHEVKKPIWPGKRGLHGAIKIIDALLCAPGPILWRVELSGDIISGRTRKVATRRTYIARFDTTELLGNFARASALSVAHLWEPSETVMSFLLGDSSCRAAAQSEAWHYAEDMIESLDFNPWESGQHQRRPPWSAAMATAKAADQCEPWAAAKDAVWGAHMATIWHKYPNLDEKNADQEWSERNNLLTEYVGDLDFLRMEIINGSGDFGLENING